MLILIFNNPFLIRDTTFRIVNPRISLVVQWLRLCTAYLRGRDSIPDPMLFSMAKRLKKEVNIPRLRMKQIISKKKYAEAVVVEVLKAKQLWW